MSEKKAMHVCVRCDRVYYEAPLKDWEGDREGHIKLALAAKKAHLCPWKKRKLKRQQQKKQEA